MGGTWSPTSPPSDPGFYVNFEAMATATVSGGQTGVVLIPLHDAVWGPAGSNELYSLAEYDRIYSNADVGARKAVAGAFTGTGYRPGAERVIVFRVDEGGDKSGVTVSGVDFEGRYPGEYINGWTVSIMSDPSIEEHVVTLTDTDGQVRWSMEYTCPAADLAASIGPEPNNWFTVDVDNSAYTGVDGSEVFAGGMPTTPSMNLESVIETEILNNDFNVITTYDDDASGIVMAITENAKQLNLEGKRFMAVVGGKDTETVDDAVAAAVALGNENIVRVGYTNLETENGVISTAEFAPQLAGIIASNGPFRSITANHISGMRVSQKATKSDLRKARNAGVVMLVEDQIGARLYQDMTTYTAENIHKPRKEFGVIKAVMVHHQVETDLTRAAEGGWIGGSNVNTANYRRAVLDGITGYLMRIEGAAMILPGWEVGLDEMYDNTGDSIHIKYGIKTTRVVERILNTIVLH